MLDKHIRCNGRQKLMKYFGESNDQFCYIKLWFVSSVEGEKVIFNCSTFLGKIFLSSESRGREEALFICLFCFIFKEKYGFSVEGHWEQSWLWGQAWLGYSTQSCHFSVLVASLPLDRAPSLQGEDRGPHTVMGTWDTAWKAMGCADKDIILLSWNNNFYSERLH